MQYLNLNYDWRVSSVSITAIARSCPDLRILYICGCRRVSSAALVELARFCPLYVCHLFLLVDCVTDRVFFANMDAAFSTLGQIVRG